MKSERRHELSRNALEAELFRIWEFLRRHGSSLAWGALGVAAVVLGIVWYVTKTGREAAQTQETFARLALGLPEQRDAELEAIAAKTSQPRWAAMATVLLGEDCRAKMVERWYEQTEADRSALRSQAQAYFHKVISDFPKEEAAVARAHYGLGKLAEDSGDLEAARAQYIEALQAGQTNPALRGDPIWPITVQALSQLGQFQGVVYMPASAPAPEPNTVPATGPATGPATAPASGPATSSAPASGPATRTSRPSSGPEATPPARPTSGPSPRPRPTSRPASAPASSGATTESD